YPLHDRDCFGPAGAVVARSRRSDQAHLLATRRGRVGTADAIEALRPSPQSQSRAEKEGDESDEDLETGEPQPQIPSLHVPLLSERASDPASPAMGRVRRWRTGSATRSSGRP